MMDFWSLISVFQREIEAKRSMGGNWRWDHFIDREDLRGINMANVCRAAGCWERGDNPAGYHFYTNGNHPMWRT